MENEYPLDPPPGTWRVLDPDGNIVDWGPGISLEMSTSIGDEEAVNGSD